MSFLRWFISIVVGIIITTVFTIIVLITSDDVEYEGSFAGITCFLASVVSVLLIGLRISNHTVMIILILYGVVILGTIVRAIIASIYEVPGIIIEAVISVAIIVFACVFIPINYKTRDINVTTQQIEASNKDSQKEIEKSGKSLA